MERIKKFFNDESGASAAEYALLVALIAVAIIAGATILGQTVNSIFSDSAGTINGTT